MSATIYGSGDSIWNGSRGTFFWTVESMARRTADERLSARLKDLADSGVNWLDLDDFTSGQKSELLTLIGQSLEVANRELPPSSEREAFLDELRGMHALERTCTCGRARTCRRRAVVGDRAPEGLVHGAGDRERNRVITSFPAPDFRWEVSDGHVAV